MRRHWCGERPAPAAALRNAAPGRHGAPPPVTTNRREELADGEAVRAACPHEKRGPGREIAVLERCEARLSQERQRTEGPMRQAALRPPRFLRGLTNASDAQRARARG